MPYMVSEYGGIKWTPDMFTNENSDRRKAWGYGNAVKSLEEFVDRFCRQTAAIMATPNVMGLCYTQLTDIEQEQNGLYYYDRTYKWDEEIYAKFRETLSKKAAIEDCPHQKTTINRKKRYRQISFCLYRFYSV